MTVDDLAELDEQDPWVECPACGAIYHTDETHCPYCGPDDIDED